MITSKEWARYIRKENIGQLHGIKQTLFQDLDETFEYIAGLMEVAFDLGKLPRSVTKSIYDLIEGLRKAYWALPFDQATRVVLALGQRRGNPGVDDNMVVLVLGSARGDKLAGIRTLRHLLDVNDQFMADPSKAVQCAAVCRVIFQLISMSANTSGGTHVWENAVQWMHEAQDTAILERLMTPMLAGIPGTFTAEPLSAWRTGQGCLSSMHGMDTFTLPVPDDLLGWFREQLVRAMRRLEERQQGLVRLAEMVRDHAAVYRDQYETMWLEMMIQPRHGLRPGGLDSITIEVTELQVLGYRRLVLEPETDFPNFRARYEIEFPAGGGYIMQLALVPSDLLLVQQAPLFPESVALLVWVDRLLAFLAVRAMWRIVMDRPPPAQGKGLGGGSGGGDAVIRPHFRRLPSGQQMSEEARANALATFRTVPLPGFTFVSRYQRGANPQSGDPLFALKTDEIALPASVP